MTPILVVNNWGNTTRYIFLSFEVFTPISLFYVLRKYAKWIITREHEPKYLFFVKSNMHARFSKLSHPTDVGNEESL